MKRVRTQLSLNKASKMLVTTTTMTFTRKAKSRVTQPSMQVVTSFKPTKSSRRSWLKVKEVRLVKIRWRGQETISKPLLLSSSIPLSAWIKSCFATRFSNQVSHQTRFSLSNSFCLSINRRHWSITRCTKDGSWWTKGKVESVRRRRADVS